MNSSQKDDDFMSYFLFQVSSMGITPFFVENVSELQLCAIKLVTAVSYLFIFLLRMYRNSFYLKYNLLLWLTLSGIIKKSVVYYSYKNFKRTFFQQVFSRYEKHRQLILEEIFTSLARLPTSKRSLRNFR